MTLGELTLAGAASMTTLERPCDLGVEPLLAIVSAGMSGGSGGFTRTERRGELAELLVLTVCRSAA